MNKYILSFFVFIGLISQANAQSSQRPIQRILQKPVFFNVDSIAEDRLGVVTVYFRTNNFPVEMSVNGQDTITVTADRYIGCQTFYADPVVKEGGPYRRSYVAYARTPRIYFHREFTYFAPARQPL